jgi:hypothetical protein
MSTHHGRPKRRKPKRSRLHIGPDAGIACAAACDGCAHLIGDPEPDPESGIRMALIHTHHVPELVADGWVLTEYEHDLPDVTCLHYHLQHWEGGHGADCCGLPG